MNNSTESNIVKQKEIELEYSHEEYCVKIQLRNEVENLKEDKIIAISAEKKNNFEKYIYKNKLNYDELKALGRIISPYESIEEVYDFISCLNEEQLISIKEIVNETFITLLIKNKILGFKKLFSADIQLQKKERDKDELIDILYKTLKEKEKEIQFNRRIDINYIILSRGSENYTINLSDFNLLDQSNVTTIEGKESNNVIFYLKSKQSNVNDKFSFISQVNHPENRITCSGNLKDLYDIYIYHSEKFISKLSFYDNNDNLVFVYGGNSIRSGYNKLTYYLTANESYYNNEFQIVLTGFSYNNGSNAIFENNASYIEFKNELFNVNLNKNSS